MPPALVALAKAGSDAVAPGTAMRSLYQFFGPYLPIRVLVPAHEVQRAREVLRPLITPQSARWDEEEPVEPSPPAEAPPDEPIGDEPIPLSYSNDDVWKPPTEPSA